MRPFWNALGVILIAMGGVFFVQGIGLLGGSVMSGQTLWAVIGAAAILLGAGVLLYFNRPQNP